MSELFFNCPKCKSQKLEEVLVDATIYTPITSVFPPDEKVSFIEIM